MIERHILQHLIALRVTWSFRSGDDRAPQPRRATSGGGNMINKIGKR